MSKRKGFTLIELLVVIAIIALLMAILMPMLQRVKRQAKAIGCQSNLKQWGLIFSMYANDNTGRFPGWLEAGEPWPHVLKALWPYHRDTNDLFVCPMAMKPQSELLNSGNWHLGSTFSAWSLRSTASHIRVDCSYGLNIWAQYVPESEAGGSRDSRYWQTVPAKGAANVPLLLDSVLWWACGSTHGNPPEYEDVWTDGSLPRCMNRHDGFVNGIFMDWSIRRVVLKELWTVKWHREFNTHGPWTNEFILSILEDREPLVNIYEALAMSVPGVVAHQSALKDGETLKVPQYAPPRRLGDRDQGKGANVEARHVLTGPPALVPLPHRPGTADRTPPAG